MVLGIRWKGILEPVAGYERGSKQILFTARHSRQEYWKIEETPKLQRRTFVLKYSEWQTDS